MKFKIGDKVRIKEGINHTTTIREDVGFLLEMDKYIGKTLIIDYIDVDNNNYEVENGESWSFAEEWLEFAK